MQEAEAWNAGFSAEKGLENIVNICLSKEHCASPASGCLATALAADVGREPELVKEAFTEGLRALIGAFANQISEEAEVDRQERALAVLSEIVGAVALARAVSDPELASQILSSAKMHLLGPIGIKGEAKNRISREEGASFATDGRKP
jgi:TetR/AcrR family transcriptional repressor of nem operon